MSKVEISMRASEDPNLKPFRRRHRVLGMCGAVVLVAGVLGGGGAAFAATNTDGTFADLQSDASSAGSETTSVLANDIDASNQTLNVSASPFTLDLAGRQLRLDSIQLRVLDGDGIPTFGTMTVTDSLGGGKLIVTHTSGSGPAIEVDSPSTFTVNDADVSATGAPNSVGATVGPTWASGSTFAPGLVTVSGSSTFSASTSGSGAAIGGANHGVAFVNISDEAKVNASTTGTGAAIGGGASPSGQAVGSVHIGDDAIVTATSSGPGAAIGGGYHGGGGGVAIDGFSTVVAYGGTTSGSTGAGIGDGEAATAGSNTTVTIGGSAHVTARGGAGGAAAIGGGLSSYGNDSVIIGGRAVVSATGIAGPGIGGEKNRAGVSVSIGDSATVTATGGGNGAGIGGGDSESASFPSVGAATSISGTARVTVASSNPSISAIGPGTGTDWGTLSNAGVLILNGGQFISVPSGASADSSGTLLNSGAINVDGTFTSEGALTNTGSVSVSRYATFTNTGTVFNTGTISGAGTVANNGSIVQSGTLSAAYITGNNFKVIYDPQAGSSDTVSQLVYADTTDGAAITIPSASPATKGRFAGWNVNPDGTGAALTRSASISSLAGGSTDGSSVPFHVYALYQLEPVLPTASALRQGIVGQSYSDTVAVTAGTAPIKYSETGAFPAGLTLDPATGVITGTPTTYGTFTMHLTAANALTSATHDYTIQIVPTPITLSVPTTAKGTSWYLAGSSATLKIGGLQANENYSISIGGKTVATGKASSNSLLTKKVTVPRSIGDGSQLVKVSGEVHVDAATSRILTASVAKSLGLKLSAKKVKHGKKIVISISKLYAGESARVVIKGKHGKTAVGKATSKGAYVVTLKHGLAKGKYTVTVTGAGTGRKASAKLTVS
jgi:hypothetical protein